MSQGEVVMESLNFKPLMGNVKPGTFFVYEKELCVRTSGVGSGEWEAFGFERKKKFYIPHTERVAVVDCQLRYSYTINPQEAE